MSNPGFQWAPPPSGGGGFDPSPAPLDESQLGRYRVVGKLGEGGMGHVFLVEDPLGRRFALKTLQKVSGIHAQQALRRFQREVELGQRLHHPGIQAVHDSHLEGPRPYVVAELLDGGTLSERLQGGPLPMGEVLRIGRCLARALRYAHERGVVHRDLKPSNVLFRGADPVLVDFGLAVSLGPNTVRLTLSGEVLGTPAYMTPEQAQGRGSDHPANDAYGLGVLLYLMLAGENPLEFGGAAHMAGVLATILNEPPKPLRPRRPEVAPSLERLVLALLAKDPLERPTMDDVEVVLERLLQQPERRRGWSPLALLSLLLGVSLSLAGGAWLASRTAGSVAPSPGAGVAHASPSVAADPSATPGSAETQVDLLCAQLDEGIARGAPGKGLPRHVSRELLHEGARARELRFLCALAAELDGQLARAEDLVETLRDQEDRWGLLARCLQPPPDDDALAQLRARFPECPYRLIVQQDRGEVSERLAELETYLRRADFARYVPLWLLKAFMEGFEGRREAARESVRRARELSGRERPAGSAAPLAYLALCDDDLERATELWAQAALRHPGRWHLFLAGTYERRGRFADALAAFREGARRGRRTFLHMALREGDGWRQRMLRYAGVPFYAPERPEGEEYGPAAQALRDRLSQWAPDASQRARLREVIELAQRGHPWSTLAPKVEALREALGQERRWWLLELQLQRSRLRLDAAREVLARLEQRDGRTPRWQLEGVAIDSFEWRELSLQRWRELVEAAPDSTAGLTSKAFLALGAKERRVAIEAARAALEQAGPDPATFTLIAYFKALGRPQGVNRLREHLEAWLLLDRLAAFEFYTMEAADQISSLPDRPQPIDEGRLGRTLAGLESVMSVGPAPLVFLRAARLALRLKLDTDWAKAVPSWLEEAREGIAQVHPKARSALRRELTYVTGLFRMHLSAREEEVRSAWRASGVEPAPWEANWYQQRYGRAYTPR